MVTQEQVEKIQNTWGDGVVKIGALKHDRKECEKEQFRPTKSEALSYFISGDDRACDEDKGFAIQPWTKVRFENTGFILEIDRAISMGNYFFTDLDGNEAKVEYTFGYKSINGNLKIDLHHSSFPYSI